MSKPWYDAEWVKKALKQWPVEQNTNCPIHYNEADMEGLCTLASERHEAVGIWIQPEADLILTEHLRRTAWEQWKVAPEPQAGFVKGTPVEGTQWVVYTRIDGCLLDDPFDTVHEALEAIFNHFQAETEEEQPERDDIVKRLADAPAPITLAPVPCKNPLRCCFCFKTWTTGTFDSSKPEQHEDTCPWAMAKKLIGD